MLGYAAGDHKYVNVCLASLSLPIKLRFEIKRMILIMCQPYKLVKEVGLLRLLAGVTATGHTVEKNSFSAEMHRYPPPPLPPGESAS